MFENVKIRGIHATRFYASWVRSGGGPKSYDKFKDWLKSLGLTDDECGIILELARNGKLELETSVKYFLKEIKTSE
jgi:hypothetical protein